MQQIENEVNWYYSAVHTAFLQGELRHRNVKNIFLPKYPNANRRILGVKATTELYIAKELHESYTAHVTVRRVPQILEASSDLY